MLLPIRIILYLLFTNLVKHCVASPTPPKLSELAHHTLLPVPSVQVSHPSLTGRLGNIKPQAEVDIYKRPVVLNATVDGKRRANVQMTSFRALSVITVGPSSARDPRKLSDRDVIDACMTKIGQAAAAILVFNTLGNPRAIGFRVGQYSLDIYAVAGLEGVLVKWVGELVKLFLYGIRRLGAFLGFWEADFLLEGREHVRIAVSAGIIG